MGLAHRVMANQQSIMRGGYGYARLFAWEGAPAKLRTESKVAREKLKAGDHVYSWRGYVNSHHGIYIGEGQVIHFNPGGGREVECVECGHQRPNAGGVIKSCLDCFLAGGELYLYEYGVSPLRFFTSRGGTCKPEPSGRPEEVERRAFGHLADGFGAFSLLSNNCEDFAIYCKTGSPVTSRCGVGRSGQVHSLLSALFVVALLFAWALN